MWRPGIQRFITLFEFLTVTIPEFLEMAPLLLFEPVPVAADSVTSPRVGGFWEFKLAEPRIANRFELNMASEETVGFTMVS